MNEAQVTILRRRQPPVRGVRVTDLTDLDRPRTLLLGRTRNGGTLHVWLAKELIQRAVFFEDGHPRHAAHRSSHFLPIGLVVPDHHVFSESTDFEFAALLVDIGAELTFAEVEPRRGRQRLADYGPYQHPVVEHRPV